MTTTISYANATDGWIESSNASYSTALSGGGSFTVAVASNPAQWGQDVTGLYWLKEVFLEFPYTRISTDVITAAYIRVKADFTNGTSVSRDMEISEYNWGGSLTSADWRTPSQLGALTRLASIINAEDADFEYMMAGSGALLTRLDTTGTVSVVVASSRLRLSTAPTVNETSELITSESSGTADDPALIFTSAPASRLFGVLGAQVQLSDGTHAYLEWDGTTNLTAVSVKHRNAVGTVTTIGTINIDSTPDPNLPFLLGAAGQGAQQLTLVCDASDNLYVVGAFAGVTGP